MTTLPLTVPYTFGNTTTQNQLTYLDADFTTIFNAVNGIGNGSVTLSTPVITGNANFTSGTTNFGPFANSNGPNLYLINTNSVSNSGGSLVFLNNNTSAVQKTAAYINGGLLSATAGAEQGIIDFEVFDGTNNVNRIIGMQVNASGASGTFAPNTDNYWSLGLSGYRWSYVYAANGVFTGAVTTAALTASSLSLSTALSAANGGTGVSNASLTPITATGSTTARTLGTRFANPLNLRDFGATGNGVTNDSIAFAAWLAAVLASGTPGYIPQGTYVLTTQVVFSMNALSTVGVTIFGDGVQQSILDVQGVSSYPQVLLTCTATPADFDYIVMRDFGIRGNCAGPVFQIGAENYSDPCNEPEFDLWVTNFSTSTSAIAVELNYVLNGQLRFVADVAGAGVAVRVRQTEFSTFQGSYSALGGTSLQITAGVSFGNLFENLDLENVATCVKIDSSNAVNNIFLGGQWSYTAGAINATAGKDNVFIAPNPAPVSPGTLAGFLTSATGVLLMGPGYFGISTPAVPSSGVPVTNNSGQMVVVSVGSVPLSSVAINGVTYPDIVINVSGTNYQTAAGSYVLSPGDTITLNYSGSTPSWVWKPLP